MAYKRIQVAEEAPVVQVDDAAEREKRPSSALRLVENLRKHIVAILQERPDLPSPEMVRRAREAS